MSDVISSKSLTEAFTFVYTKKYKRLGIGKINEGFDFFGYRFNQHGIIPMVKKSVHYLIERIVKIYEENAN